MDMFDTISPLDYRYYGSDQKLFERIQPYLSEAAMIRHMAQVEGALALALSKKGVCSKKVAQEIEEACKTITPEEVYAEEARIKHNVRALANCIRAKVSDEAKQYVHFSATSHDIICTADALRCKRFTKDVLVPALVELEKTLIQIAEREKETLQIGRTHGQHAEPITFGFAIASYVSRLGKRIKKVRIYGSNLKGKLAGAVGAYNASSIFIEDPLAFERDFLAEIGLKRGKHSTQIVEPEYMADLVYALISAMGVLANLADDMRQLQRSEIAEVAEAFGSEQVGSSTMPHKRNPISFENVKSLWKVFSPRMVTLFMDQISEHQRDLTNSASSRFTVEVLAGLLIMADRMQRAMQKLVVDNAGMRKNFDLAKDHIIAEPLYILLAAHGHPDAHEYSRRLTLQAAAEKKPLPELVFADKEIAPYLKKCTKKQLDILRNPAKYVGMSAKKVDEVCRHWRKELKIE